MDDASGEDGASDKRQVSSSTLPLSFEQDENTFYHDLFSPLATHEGSPVSIPLSDLDWFHPIFGVRPPNIMPVIVISDDLESADQINDLWDFFPELEAF
ncbi:hypothetical protein DFS33DRAFT_1380606 [Desarmillaria ectypa]|nr:hypothetical protein DFS33DRAFT_1380606 [Desarmillaria ectypa]